MADPARTSSGSIDVLPPHLIDQIAAGEVIERPASVVKELIENAIDAAATQIDVEIEGAGSKQMRVVDNGVGMTPADVVLAIQRHATSKIRSLDDLSSIMTFGFRGEALAAVGSVSHLEIVSRPRGVEAALLKFWEGGVPIEERTLGAPTGTAVTVRHLFYNTPARREYLRAPTTESKRLIETVTDFACVHHRIGFTLTVDGKPLLRLAPADTMRPRLVDLFGTKTAEALIDFSGGDAELGVSGFAGKPELARTTRDRILIYVNSRRVGSPSIAHAATAAYGETIPRGRFPFAIVCVNVNPRRVDVNVHPTKREVRFASGRAIYDLTHYSINKSIFASSRTAPVMSLDNGEGAGPAGAGHTFPGTAMPRPPSAVGTAPERDAALRLAMPTPHVERGGEGATADAESSPVSQFTPQAAVADGVSNLWQFNDVYIAAVVGDELWIIDQHTAHERIQYEALLKRMDERSADSQQLLFPESIELEPQVWPVFEESQELLVALGFQVREFGARTVLLEGVPVGLRVKNPVTLFRRVVEDIEIARKAGEDLRKAAAMSTACRSSVMAGDRLKPAEMQALFSGLMHTENPFSCPHGRPTMVKIPIADFDRRFCRK
ncbi:MAG TPA: DNA mismatch repair endonuclease MutL [Acidobacteriota bacterium]|nr:DNA mismatch repair endonuclease MutL [Acidobacteriota bacterium]